MEKIILAIENGNTYLGIEFGSTRIKAILLGDDYHEIASGTYDWENQLVAGYWTYDMIEVRKGLRTAYSELRQSVIEKYGIDIKRIGTIGISAMMHGYIALDSDDNLLVPFRTWRNTTAGNAAELLSEQFDFNIPERWTIAHLYQAVLDGEAHLSQLSYVTTLAGYVHFLLTGEKVLGVGDASGMFPIESKTIQGANGHADDVISDWDQRKIEIFDEILVSRGYPIWIFEHDSSDEIARDSRDAVGSDSSDEIARDSRDAVGSDSSDEIARDSRDAVGSDSSDEITHDGSDAVGSDGSDEITHDGSDAVGFDSSDAIARDSNNTAAHDSVVKILPKVLVAGEAAGTLTEIGAILLDETGNLEAGIPFCPPEGDAGTGMVATNSVRKGTGNISVGTSVFAMIVLENALKQAYREIDMVTTPDGSHVAMVHANNCTSDLNAWMKLLSQSFSALGIEVENDELFSKILATALEGDADCGGLMSYGYYSGEFITGLVEGRPLLVRTPQSAFDLPNFMRLHLSTAFAAVALGMDILKGEGVQVRSILGHGGLFKTKTVAQTVLSAALGTEIGVSDTAGEGGAYGMALLASYAAYARAHDDGRSNFTDFADVYDGDNNNNSSNIDVNCIEHARLSLADYLDQYAFSDVEIVSIDASEADKCGYRAFLERYKRGLAIEVAAVDAS
ncbi:MAG: hypothetical protein LBN22_00680 [Clostridiales Family XIII bacterium]|nr:hypothetical protein [Clostridiales Family XIII bacterium]